MRTNSPLHTLVTLLHERGWNAHGVNALESVGAIRSDVLEPVLACLGWDLDAADRVLRNDNRTGIAVDYTLLDQYGGVLAIIQCVPGMDGPIEREILFTAMAYAEHARIDAIIFTSGRDWKFFAVDNSSSHLPDHRLDLRHDELSACAAILVTYLDYSLGWHLSRSRAGQSQPVGWRNKPYSQPASDAVYHGNHRPINPMTTESNRWLTLPEVAEIVTSSKPERFRLPDGRDLALKTWREVLVAACEFTIEQNPATTLPFRDVSGRGINLMSYYQEYPANRISVIEIAEQRIYVYIHYAARAALANIAHVLRMAGSSTEIPPAIVLASQRTVRMRHQLKEASTDNYNTFSSPEQAVPRTITMEFDE